MIEWESQYSKEYPQLTMRELIYVLKMDKTIGGHGYTYINLLKYFSKEYEQVGLTTLKRQVSKFREENLDIVPQHVQNVMDKNLKINSDNFKKHWDSFVKNSTQYYKLKTKGTIIKPKLIHVSNSNNVKKILSLSDLHMPFHLPNLIMDIVKLHSDADICVINGDIFNASQYTSFINYKYISFNFEYKLALELIDILSKTFDQVILTKGNHDIRLNKTLAKKLDVESYSMLNVNLLKSLSKGLEYNEQWELVNKRNFKNVSAVDHWTKIGDTIFVHPHKIQGGLDNFASYLVKYFDSFLSLDNKCTNIVCAHTHKIGSKIVNGIKVIFQGALCYPLDYSFDADMKYAEQQTLGYTVIYQKNNKTDINTIENHCCGTLMPSEGI